MRVFHKVFKVLREFDFSKLMVILSFTALLVVMQPSTPALAQPCACVTSDPRPLEGQSARSSQNFNTRGCGNGIQWQLPGIVSAELVRDIRGGSDKKLANLFNGQKTENFGGDMLYIANPKNASEPFLVCAANQ